MRRVIVVVHDKDVADLTVQVLKLDGFDAISATSAFEALEQIARLKPHCVVLDCEPDDSIGAALGRIVRARFGHSILLVGVSAWHEDEPEVQELIAVCDHFFTKPVPWERFAHVLHAPH